MLTPCLLIPDWSLHCSLFHLFNIPLGCRLFFHFPSLAGFFSPPTEVPLISSLSFIWSSAYKFIACCWNSYWWWLVDECSGKHHEYKNQSICLYCSNYPPVRCTCPFLLSLDNHYCRRSLAEQKWKFNRSMCSFFLWLKVCLSPCHCPRTLQFLLLSRHCILWFVPGCETPSTTPALRLNSLTLHVFKEAEKQRQVNYFPEPKCRE